MNGYVNQMPEQDSTPDWVHLPPGVEALSLWECLHDARLTEMHSDRASRSVATVADVFYIREHHQLPTDLTFRIQISEVESVRALGFSPGPEQPPDLTGKSFEEQKRLVAEFHKSWREESLDWQTVEDDLNRTSLNVEDAELAAGPNGAAVYLSGCLDEDRYTALWIRGRAVSVERSDCVPCSLEEFLTMGQSYWTAFAERARQRQGT